MFCFILIDVTYIFFLLKYIRSTSQIDKNDLHLKPLIYVFNISYYQVFNIISLISYFPIVNYFNVRIKKINVNINIFLEVPLQI